MNCLEEMIKDSLSKHADGKCNLAESIANDLLTNGVIIPPCKIGDRVYVVTLNTETLTCEVHRGYIGCIDIRSTGKYVIVCHEGYDDEPYFKNIAGRFEDFGKTIFFTEEEAGKLLERCKKHYGE